MTFDHEKMEDDLYENIMEKYDKLCKTYVPTVNLENDGLGNIEYGSTEEYDAGETYIESIDDDDLSIMVDISFMGNNLNNFCECILEELSTRNTFEISYYYEKEKRELFYTMTTKVELNIHMFFNRETATIKKFLSIIIHIY